MQLVSSWEVISNDSFVDDVTSFKMKYGMLHIH